MQPCTTQVSSTFLPPRALAPPASPCCEVQHAHRFLASVLRCLVTCGGILRCDAPCGLAPCRSVECSVVQGLGHPANPWDGVGRQLRRLRSTRRQIMYMGCISQCPSGSATRTCQAPHSVQSGHGTPQTLFLPKQCAAAHCLCTLQATWHANCNCLAVGITLCNAPCHLCLCAHRSHVTLTTVPARRRPGFLPQAFKVAGLNAVWQQRPHIRHINFAANRSFLGASICLQASRPWSCRVAFQPAPVAQ